MIRFLALILALSAVTNGAVRVPNAFTSRLVGGFYSDIDEFPFLLSLRDQDNTHFCAANLISLTWAVSTARCTIDRDISTIQAVAGTGSLVGGGEFRTVVEVIIHPSFDENTLDNDISLIRVEVPFTESESVSPATLPTQGQEVPVNKWGYIAGWGVQSEGSTTLAIVLRESYSLTLPQATCESIYADKLTSNMFCAGDLDGRNGICDGDFGGPLVISKTLLGLISWSEGCARPNYPGVYTRLSAYRDWIATNTGV